VPEIQLAGPRAGLLTCSGPLPIEAGSSLRQVYGESAHLTTGQASLRGFRPETRQAVDAVERALELAVQRTGADDATSKGGRDLVTATDVAVEDTIRGLLADAPGLTVLGEERGGETPRDGAAYWLVDPICGTRNYASGIPLYSVNLALVEGDQVTVAAVGDPSRREITIAERGRGAWALRDGTGRLARGVRPSPCRPRRRWSGSRRWW